MTRNIYAEVYQEVGDRVEILVIDEGYSLLEAYEQTFEDMQDGLERPKERSEYADIWDGHINEALRALRAIKKVSLTEGK